MKKKDMQMRDMEITKRVGKENRVKAILEKFENRIGGKKGAEAARDRFVTMVERLYPVDTEGEVETPEQNHQRRLTTWEKNSAVILAKKANANFDGGRGRGRSDYLSVSGIDYVPPWESTEAPYWDMGGKGLALVQVTRTRVYAGSRWMPSSVSTYFLVGRNETGTYFSHPVSPNCQTVEDAVQWIWDGKAYHIIQRQGDIAFIKGSGPKMPSYLPWGHRVQGDVIVHRTHPDLPVAKKGERIIVARRAAERATNASRD